MNKHIPNYEELVDIVYSHEKAVESNFHGKEDQIFIHKELVEAILTFLQQDSYKMLNKRFLIKSLFMDLLELTNDAVFIIKNDYIFIKKYDDSKRKVSTKSNSIENRYNGIDVEDLDSFYEANFMHGEPELLFQEVCEEFYERYFVEQHISNLDYEQNVFSLVQKLVVEILKEEYDSSESFCVGFAGYIFRKHFKHFFHLLAQTLLREVAFSNKVVTSFLEYYSLRVTVIQGVRYKIPELESDNGMRWNLISMLSVIRTYFKAKQGILEFKEEKELLEKQVEDLYIGDMSPVKYNEIYHKEMDRLERAIENNAEEYEKIADTIAMTKDHDKLEVLRLSMHNNKQAKVDILDKKNQLLKKRVRPEILQKYTLLNKEIETKEKEIRLKKNVLKQNNEAYQSIESAVAAALIKKREKLSKEKSS